MDSVKVEFISTPRIRFCLRSSGQSQAPETIFYIHGNASSSLFWKEQMQLLPPQYRAFAPDLRGYGDTQDLLIDATKGMGDFAEDLVSLIDVLQIESLHLVGHSMGGSVIWKLAPLLADKVKSITLVNPGSPYGFGGTKNIEGEPCNSDFAGSGGGIVNPQFTQYISEKYRGTDDPLASPRVVMNNFYWKPPFKANNEEELLDSLLSQKIGSDRYPGDFTSSPNYPFVAPGIYGTANALSPRYVGNMIEEFLDSPFKAPILWVRGSDDQIVSDNSLFCMGTLGKMGLIPNYSGENIYPPQPMVSQTREVLKKYQDRGGQFEEIIMDNTGHTPYIEKPVAFLDIFLKHISAV